MATHVTMGRHCRRLAVALAVAAVALTSACSSSGGSGSTPNTNSSGSASGSAATGNVSSVLARGYAGTDGALPATAPKPASGKSVWVLSCAQFSPGCALPAQAAATAGQAIGWNMSVKDGKLDPATDNSIIRSAIAAHVNAIILVSVGCSSVSASLQAAKSAGIKIYGVLSEDCTPAVFDANLTYADGSYANYLQAGTQLLAAWTASKTAGNAKVIVPEITIDPTLTALANDYVTALSSFCSGCQVYKVAVPPSVIASNTIGTFLTATLAKYPQANVVDGLVDGLVLLGGAQTVSAANRQGRHILLLGNEGFAANIKMIKAGVQAVASGTPTQWVGYAAIDGLNRLFAGQKQVSEGIGHQLVDAAHLPSSALGQYGYDGNSKSSGFASHYLKIWGR